MHPRQLLLKEARSYPLTMLANLLSMFAVLHWTAILKASNVASGSRSGLKPKHLLLKNLLRFFLLHDCPHTLHSKSRSLACSCLGPFTNQSIVKLRFLLGRLAADANLPVATFPAATTFRLRALPALISERFFLGCDLGAYFRAVLPNLSFCPSFRRCSFEHAPTE